MTASLAYPKLFAAAGDHLTAMVTIGRFCGSLRRHHALQARNVSVVASLREAWSSSISELG